MTYACFDKGMEFDVDTAQETEMGTTIYVYKHRTTGEVHFYHERVTPLNHWPIVAEYELLEDARRDYPKAVDHRPLGE